MTASFVPSTTTYDVIVVDALALKAGDLIGFGWSGNGEYWAGVEADPDDGTLHIVWATPSMQDTEAIDPGGRYAVFRPRQEAS